MATKRDYDELLVYGYLRRESKRFKPIIDIPEDIMNICVLWYHIQSYLFKAGKHCEINENGTKVTHKKKKGRYEPNSCYGSVVMPSINNVNIEYKYKIKIVKFDSNEHICVGVDDAKCINTDADFSGNQDTKNYAYYKSGNLFDHTTGTFSGKLYGDAFDKGDIIEMCYNPYKSTLLFILNETRCS